MTRGEKNRNGSLQTDCDSRTGSEVTSNGKLRVWVWFDTVWKKNRQGGSWVSHVPWPESKISQVRRDDQSRCHNLKPPSSLGSGWNEIHCPPAKLEVLHLFRWFTHTIFHTQLCHTQLCHALSFTHNFFHKSQTTLSHTLSLTRNFVTHHLSHTTLSHIHTGICHTLTLRGRRGTWRHPPSFCVAGVALGDIHLHFAWQAWRLQHWAGSGGAWARLFAGDAAVLCLAGVALGDIHLRFAWQAWHLVTSTLVSRGRRGTWWHSCSICVALGWSHTIFHIQFCHTQLFTYNLFYHLLCLSFLPRPATTFLAHFRKKLTCGVIQSFNYIVWHSHWQECIMSDVCFQKRQYLFCHASMAHNVCLSNGVSSVWYFAILRWLRFGNDWDEPRVRWIEKFQSSGQEGFVESMKSNISSPKKSGSLA